MTAIALRKEVQRHLLADLEEAEQQIERGGIYHYLDELPEAYRSVCKWD
jgi:hypothetical protein